MSPNFSQLVSPQFERLINDGNNSVAAQVHYDISEETIADSERFDPICDVRFTPVKGITRRYANRVLLKPTLRCAVHCRFCFRRDQLAGEEGDLTVDELETALDYIQSQKELSEVILTGGDPLLLNDSKLESLLTRLVATPHIRTVRIHTRIPTALPGRVTPRLTKILDSIPLVVWVVAHINSAEEISPECEAAVAALRKSGVVLLSQTVLLKNVNASVAELEALCTRLIQIGVKPYYLHYPDLVRGTSHFRLPLTDAIEMVSALQSRLSGIAMPQLVVDLPSGGGKVPILPENYQKITDRRWRFRNPSTHEWEEVAYE